MSSSSALEHTQSEYTCRICLEDGQRVDFIAPCACAGSQRWVHRECLDKWRSMREDKAFSRCTECLKPYKMVSRSENNEEMTHSRRCRFISLILRDFAIVLAFSQLCIIVLGLIVFGFDMHSHALINILHQSSRPVLFYYLAGLFFSLSILGMGFSVVQIGCCGDQNGSCSHCHNNTCGGSNYVCLDVYYPCVYTGPHGGALDCCVCCQHGECCGACCTESTGTAGAGCSECAAGASVGEECVMCMVVAAVVFAIVGMFVCVVLGAAYAQSVVRTHYHVLQKYTLASDFIVADLAEGALPLSEHGGSGDSGGSGSGGSGGSGGTGAREGATDGGGAAVDGSGEARSRLISWWSRPSSATSNQGYTRAATGEAGEGAEEFGLDVEEGSRHGNQGGGYRDSSSGTIELLPLPSAPQLPTATHGGMDRFSSASALNHYPDASAPLIHSGNVNSSSTSASPLASAPPLPYDPYTHHFSRTQYQELLSRGLL